MANSSEVQSDISFRVVPCKYWDKNIGHVRGYLIVGPSEMFFANTWLHLQQSVNTSRDYAYKLCRWLNYCRDIKKNYVDATEHDLNHFLFSMRFVVDDTILSLDSHSRHSTITKYVNVITGFYTFVCGFRDDIAMPMETTKEHTSKSSYLKNIVWSKERKRLLIDKKISTYKPKKNYIKWYSDEQIEAILGNLNTYRDKAVFCMTLDDMRIDEVLSLRLSDYYPMESYVIAYRSKGRITGSTGRAVALSDRTIVALESYLTYERGAVDAKLLDCDEVPPQELFLNLNNGPSYGKPLGYRNYLNILKRAARRAKVDDGLIRTHSGRSTAVMRDILLHVEHPKTLTLEDIRIKYGWQDLSSMMPYLDTSNPLLSRKSMEMLQSVSKEMKEKYGCKKNFHYSYR